MPVSSKVPTCPDAWYHPPCGNYMYFPVLSTSISQQQSRFRATYIDCLSSCLLDSHDYQFNTSIHIFRHVKPHTWSYGILLVPITPHANKSVGQSRSLSRHQHPVPRHHKNLSSLIQSTAHLWASTKTCTRGCTKRRLDGLNYFILFRSYLDILQSQTRMHRLWR